MDCTIEDGADADEIEFPAASWGPTADFSGPSSAPAVRAALRGSAGGPQKGHQFAEGAGRERDRGAVAAWPGASRSRGGAARHEPADAGTAVVVRRLVVRQHIGGSTVRLGGALSRRSGLADFRDRVTAGLRRDRHFHPRPPALDRNAAERRAGATAAAGWRRRKLAAAAAFAVILASKNKFLAANDKTVRVASSMRTSSS